MIDIETYGKSHNAAIVSIAAVAFDIETGVTYETFHANVDPATSQQAGLEIDADTVAWWMRQPQEARNAIMTEQMAIDHALLLLKGFFESQRLINDELQVWANSPSFDLVILRSAYKAFDRETPWQYWEERDVRTLVAFAPDIKKSIDASFIGNRHTPLDDCLHQIVYCSSIWNLLKS